MLIHNGNKHFVDPQLMVQVSPFAEDLFYRPPPYIIIDYYSEEAFQAFLKICHASNVQLVPSIAPDLVNLIKDWECLYLLSDIDEMLAHIKNTDLSIAFLSAAQDPTMFPKTYRYFKNNSLQNVDIPRVQPADVSYKQVLDLKIQYRNFKSQAAPDNYLTRQKVILEEEISDLKQKIDHIRQQIETIKNETAKEQTVNKKLEHQLAEHLKKIQAVLEGIKSETEQIVKIQDETYSIQEECEELRQQIKDLELKTQDLQKEEK